MTKIGFCKQKVLPSNTNFNNSVIVASCKNQDKWDIKFDIRMFLYLNVATIKNKIYLKFFLTIATNKEIPLKTKYEVLKELQERRTDKDVPKFNVTNNLELKNRFLKPLTKNKIGTFESISQAVIK